MTTLIFRVLTRLQSMPQVQRGIDRLWHCLRPPLSRYSPTPIGSISHSTSKSSNWRFFSIPNGPPRSKKPLSILNSSLQPSRSFRLIPNDLLDDARDPKVQDLRESPHDLVSPQLGNDALYNQLQDAGLTGDFVRVHDLVEVLVKERSEKPNLRLYLSLILANTNPQHGSPTYVKRLLEEIAAEGLVPDSSIYHAVLKVLAIHPDYVLRKDILEELRQRWFTITNDGWYNILVGLVRDRQLEMVLDTVEVLQAEGIKITPWLYDLITYTLCDIEEFDEAVKIMRYRVSSGGLLISATLWSYLLDTASRALHHEATLYVWRKRVETSYFNPPSGVCINILSTAARHGDFRLATDVFRVLGNRTETLRPHHFESLMESYLASSDLKTALATLTVMTSSGVIPTESSTRPIYLQLCKAPSLPSTALYILRELHDSERPIPASAVNVIIESLIYHRDLASAISTYKILHTLCHSGPTTSTFNILFRGCAKSARKDHAMFLASEMLALNVVPDALTYDRLILVCLSNLDGTDEHQDDEQGFADAWRYFEEMRSVGFWPRAGTVSALARRGCERGDERVWALVGSEVREGMGKREMENMAREHWKNGKPRLLPDVT